MPKVVFEHDLVSGRFTILNLLQEAHAELMHINLALKNLESAHRQMSITQQGAALKTLHDWLISLNETYVGAIHLTGVNEFHNASDLQLVNRVKLAIDTAQGKWQRLTRSAANIRSSMPRGPISALLR